MATLTGLGATTVSGRSYIVSPARDMCPHSACHMGTFDAILGVHVIRHEHPLDWIGDHAASKPVIDPREQLRASARAAGITIDPLFPPLALVGFSERHEQTLVALTEATPVEWANSASAIATTSPAGVSVVNRVSAAEVDGHAIVVAGIGISASVSVRSAERLIAGGVRTMLVMGATGSLRPDVTIGDYVVPTGAIREEGTSYHYMPPEYQPVGDGPATHALLAAAGGTDRRVHAGRVWTTDAMFREFESKVRAYGDDGVLGVDMESSALLTLAAVREVDVGILLTVSDHVFDPEWPNVFAHRSGVSTYVARRPSSSMQRVPYWRAAVLQPRRPATSGSGARVLPQWLSRTLVHGSLGCGPSRDTIYGRCGDDDRRREKTMVVERSRPVPRSFKLHWGSGSVAEEASIQTQHHEPCVQLLEFEDGTRSLRFCYYSLAGRFQRSPLIMSEDVIDLLRPEVMANPAIRDLIRRLVD